ncbi:MAG: DUF2079 domain-containing protein [Actinomycetota bacterium]
MDAAGALRRRVPEAIAVAFACCYAWFSLLRHAQLGTAAYDLGLFDQAIQRYAAGHAPIVDLKGPHFNLLGDHFHPILAVLAPFYRVFPDARTLLVAQAALVALSLVPIGRFAIARLGTASGLAVTAAYGLSWGILGLIAFDFHEVCFAVPLLAFAVVALAERRWWPAVWWTLPLLLVKEDLGATVVAVGIYLLLHGQRRSAAVLIGVGTVATALITLWVLPALNKFGTYRFWKTLGGVGGHRSLLLRLAALPAKFFTPTPKLVLLALLIVATGLLSLRSPLMALVVPTLGWRLLANDPLYWSHGVVHYNAVLMPIGFAALVDGIGRAAAESGDGTRGAARWIRRYARAAPAVVLAVAVLLLPWTPLAQAADGRIGEPPARVAGAHSLLRQIPDGAIVSASAYLAPQLVDRCRVVRFPNIDPEFAPDWVVADGRQLHGVPLPAAEQEAAFAALRAGASAYDEVDQREGYVLFRRGPDGAGGTYFDRTTQSWRAAGQ